MWTRDPSNGRQATKHLKPQNCLCPLLKLNYYILQDYPDTAKLLAPENVDKDALQMYAREAADFSTEYQLPQLEFAVNHYGQPDVAMFDFTSMFAAENASRVVERHGYRLLQILVGDSLLEVTVI